MLIVVATGNGIVGRQGRVGWCGRRRCIHGDTFGGFLVVVMDGRNHQGVGRLLVVGRLFLAAGFRRAGASFARRVTQQETFSSLQGCLIEIIVVVIDDVVGWHKGRQGIVGSIKQDAGSFQRRKGRLGGVG